MRAPPVAPTRLRRRLAIAFVLVGGISTGALALGSYLIVRKARLDDSAQRAVDQSTFNLRFATTEPSVTALFAAYRTRGDFCTLVITKGEAPQRSGPFCPSAVSPELRRLVAAGQLARERETLGGTRYVVVGGAVPGSDRQLYFYYDERGVWDDLDALRNVLALGWLSLTLLAGLVGTVLARRTLAPVAQASDAARSLAEGLLDTRLPVAGDDEFAAWASSFNEMAEALEAKIAALSAAEARERRFTANVAHELRTPLTALVGEAELLAAHAEAMPAEAQRLSGLLVADVARLRRLTDDLLEISRLDAGTERTETGMLDVVAAVAALLRDHGWDDRVSLSGEQVLLVTDRRRLERIVANLVGNALTHGGGSARVRIAGDAGAATLEVEDDGPGIPAEALPHVFDRFYKADRSRAAPGSGLGLAIAQENARLLGGEITVTSAPGRGALFVLQLPVTQPLPAGEGAVAPASHDGDVHHEGGPR